jgi:hypothetical protein
MSRNIKLPSLGEQRLSQIAITEDYQSDRPMALNFCKSG